MPINLFSRENSARIFDFFFGEYYKQNLFIFAYMSIHVPTDDQYLGVCQKRKDNSLQEVVMSISSLALVGL